MAGGSVGSVTYRYYPLGIAFTPVPQKRATCVSLPTISPVHAPSATPRTRAPTQNKIVCPGAQYHEPAGKLIEKKTLTFEMAQFCRGTAVLGPLEI